MTAYSARSLYIDPPSIPAGMTLREYRRTRATESRRTPRRLLRRIHVLA